MSGGLEVLEGDGGTAGVEGTARMAPIPANEHRNAAGQKGSATNTHILLKIKPRG
jgi:hypothetical protein